MMKPTPIVAHMITCKGTVQASVCCFLKVAIARGGSSGHAIASAWIRA
jgi:hypothetical protein